MKLDAKIPGGPLAEKWDKHRFEMKLVNPANKRKYKILVVGTGLAGGSAAASLAELGYNVETFCFQDSPRRATRSPPRGASTPPKIIKTTATASTACFTTRSKAAISAPARPTSIGSPSYRSTSSISAWLKGCRLPANTAACSTIAPSAALRFRAPSTAAAKPGNNFSWELIKLSAVKSAWAESRAIRARKCSIWS